MSTSATGRRSAAVGDAVELRLRDLERAIGRVASRTLNGSPGYDMKRIAAASTAGWAVGTWVKLSGTAWTAAATSSTFAPDALGVVLTVIDGTTAEIVTGGLVQLIGTSYTNATLYYLSTSSGAATSTPPAAPNVLQPLFVAYQDGWINVLGPAGAAPRSVTLAGLRDVTITTPTDGQLLKYDLASGLWKNGATTLALLSDVTLSGLSNQQVLSYDSASAKWINRTLTSVTTLAGLSDVTITSVADFDFLRYDAGSSKWKNVNLGEIAWASSTRTLVLDGGASASAASKIGIGKAGSRFIVANGTGFEFLLSGDPDVGTEKSARIRSTAATDVSFYDQATSTFGAGTQVMQWGTSSSAGSRYFRFLIPMQVTDTGTKNLVIAGTTTQTWTLGDDVGPSIWLTMLGTSADAYGRRLKLGCDIDNGGGGFTFYGDRSNGTSSSRLLVGSTDGNWYQSGNMTLTAGGALTLVGTGTTGVQMGAATSEKIGFWGKTPVTKTVVADPSAITTVTFAGASYTLTEQTILLNLKTDVTNLRATLLAVTDALQACGLF